MAEAETGNAPPQRLDDAAIEVDIRLELYRQQYGRGLWAVIEDVAAAAGSHDANYIGARANSYFFDEVQ